ncbi:MAG: MogA/MoaB family molybdenum cofactor biosynthesis protein [Desulfovibrio sp.]|nr:MogA/MoaB family molybdenum cofactor biosynthesis protein [Desulfovibrio sp.]
MHSQNSLTLSLIDCPKGSILPVLPKQAASRMPSHTYAHSPSMPPIPVGTQLSSEGIELCVVGNLRIPSDPHAVTAPLLQANTPISAGTSTFSLHKEGVSLAWITLSDKGAQGVRQDTAGPMIPECIAQALPLCLSQGFLLPDDPFALRALLTECALTNHYDIIITSGGTGITQRDTTPEATMKVLDTHLPGFTHAMMAHSLSKTPYAMLSRACAGIIGTTLVINLPGSRKAVLENLEVLLPALGHTLAKLHNDPSDCGG